MDYEKYVFNRKELFNYLIMAIVCVLMIAKLFYGKYLYAVLLSPLIIVILRIKKLQLKRKRKEKLEEQFKDMLMGMADAMSAGASSVTALKESYKEMLGMHGYNSYICQELRIILSGIKLNVPLEKLLKNFAERANIEDLNLFVAVFEIAQKKGGNMIHVVKNVADNIRQKSEVKEEIRVAINGKKYEQKIMSTVPVILIGYMLISSPGFLNVIKDIGLREPYNGQTHLVSGEIAEDLTYYFATSEQVPSSVGLGVLMDKDNHVRQAGGFIIQVMPDTDDEVIDKLEARLGEVHSVTEMLDKGMTPEDILNYVLEGMDVEILETVPTQYKCDCSFERVSKVIASLGKKELQEMIDDGKPVEVNCQFCGSHYKFDTEQLKEFIK